MFDATDKRVLDGIAPTPRRLFVELRNDDRNDDSLYSRIRTENSYKEYTLSDVHDGRNRFHGNFSSRETIHSSITKLQKFWSLYPSPETTIKLAERFALSWIRRGATKNTPEGSLRPDESFLAIILVRLERYPCESTMQSSLKMFYPERSHKEPLCVEINRFYDNFGQCKTISLQMENNLYRRSFRRILIVKFKRWNNNRTKIRSVVYRRATKNASERCSREESFSG